MRNYSACVRKPASYYGNAAKMCYGRRFTDVCSLMGTVNRISFRLKRRMEQIRFYHKTRNVTAPMNSIISMNWRWKVNEKLQEHGKETCHQASPDEQWRQYGIKLRGLRYCRRHQEMVWKETEIRRYTHKHTHTHSVNNFFSTWTRPVTFLQSLQNYPRISGSSVRA